MCGKKFFLEKPGCCGIMLYADRRNHARPSVPASQPVCRQNRPVFDLRLLGNRTYRHLRPTRLAEKSVRSDPNSRKLRPRLLFVDPASLAPSRAA